MPWEEVFGWLDLRPPPLWLPSPRRPLWCQFYVLGSSWPLLPSWSGVGGQQEESRPTVTGEAEEPDQLSVRDNGQSQKTSTHETRSPRWSLMIWESSRSDRSRRSAQALGSTNRWQRRRMRTLGRGTRGCGRRRPVHVHQRNIQFSRGTFNPHAAKPGKFWGCGCF